MAGECLEVDARHLSREGLEKAGLPINCRPVQLSQVLLNLLSNASDAVDAVNPKWVRLFIEDDETHVLIRVTDSGPGVPVNQRDQIFNPFFTTKASGKGTGLGLSIALRIVQEHNGSLFYDSKYTDTCFTLRLPKS